MQYLSLTIVAIFSILFLFETTLVEELANVEPEPYKKIIPGHWILHIPGGFEVGKRIADAEGFQSVYEIPDLNLFHLYDLKPEEAHEEHISIRLTKYMDKEITFMTPSTREKVKKRQIERQKMSPMSQDADYYCAGPGGTHYSSNRPGFYSDPLYPRQWHYRSCSDLTGSDKPSIYDMKIVQTWEQFKVTGKGIIVLVIDNGVFANHLDLKNRISMRYSKNYKTTPYQEDPTPDDPTETHGTRCAGIIAAEGNNGVCGVGIAPQATIGGQKYITHNDMDMPHRIEALKYRAEEVHIVSMSMGDNELRMFTMTEDEVLPAYRYGIEKGRGGKGIIYVFPSGNGKEEGETCSSDGSLQLIYKIVVGGAKHSGKVSDYSEGCASVMVVTHSGNGSPYGHITPDMGSPDECFDNFNGTSAGCPVASGIIALMLEANNNLTWRDVKYAIAWTSEKAPLAKNPGWIKNHAGFWVNFDFGFGLINAYELVDLALNFPGTSPPMNMCVVPYTLSKNARSIGENGEQTKAIKINTNACQGTPQEVNFIEHVLVTVTIKHSARGNLQIMLTSPQNTVTQLLPPRKKDQSNSLIFNFSFLSVHNWGEQPQGDWLVELLDTANEAGYGYISRIVLKFYGTREQPELYKNGPRKYYPSD